MQWLQVLTVLKKYIYIWPNSKYQVSDNPNQGSTGEFNICYKRNLPLDNFVGFASDGANGITGVHNSAAGSDMFVTTLYK